MVDNTNASPVDRRELIALARELRAEVIGYYLLTSADLCYQRNAERSHPVPDVGIYATLARFVVPSLAEGFDRLFHVKAEGGTFVVTEVKSDADGRP